MPRQESKVLKTALSLPQLAPGFGDTPLQKMLLEVIKAIHSNALPNAKKMTEIFEETLKSLS